MKSVDININQNWLTQWASYQIRKIADAHAPRMPGTFSPPQRASDPDMHHGTCVTHVPWCMPGSLTSSFHWIRRRGKTIPAFPAHAQPTILRIWQEAHGLALNRCQTIDWTIAHRNHCCICVSMSLSWFKIMDLTKSENNNWFHIISTYIFPPSVGYCLFPTKSYGLSY